MTGNDKANTDLPIAPTLATKIDEETHQVMQLARRHLMMDVTFIVEFVDGREVYRFSTVTPQASV